MAYLSAFGSSRPEGDIRPALLRTRLRFPIDLSPSLLVAESSIQVPDVRPAIRIEPSLVVSGMELHAPTVNVSGEEEDLPVLAVYTPSAQASLDISGIIDGTYPVIEIDYQLFPAVTDAALRFRTDAGAADVGDSGASDYAYSLTNQTSAAQALPFSTGASAIVMTRDSSGADVDDVDGCSGRVVISYLGSATRRPSINWTVEYIDASGLQRRGIGTGWRLATHEIDFGQFSFDNGNIASGLVIVRGVPGSV